MGTSSKGETSSGRRDVIKGRLRIGCGSGLLWQPPECDQPRCGEPTEMRFVRRCLLRTWIGFRFGSLFRDFFRRHLSDQVLKFRTGDLIALVADDHLPCEVNRWQARQLPLRLAELLVATTGTASLVISKIRKRIAGHRGPSCLRNALAAMHFEQVDRV